MIYFYSGTPGSGKSLRVAKDIVAKLRIKRQNVITNMNIDYNYIIQSKFKTRLNRLYSFTCKHLFRSVNKVLGLLKRKQLEVKPRAMFKDTRVKGCGKYFYLNNKNFNVKYFYDYAMAHHKRGVEGQTLIVIDEAQMLFSPSVIKLKRMEDVNYRVDWLEFFTQHRRLGYNIILISQFDRLIDAQVRCLFEYNHIHRKVNNFKLGWLLGIFKVSLFISIQYWYGIKQKMGSEFFTYRKKYSRIYDSYEFQKKVTMD